MTRFVNSKDGTKIAFSKQGNGAPLILVDGALCHRNFGANVKLPQYLTNHFEVYAFDRRGRGESGNTLPYSVEREFEDLQALIDEIGQRPYVYGISSGAALVLEAAKHGVEFKKMVVFEAPYIVDNSRPPFPDNILETMQTLIHQKQYGKTLKYFLKFGVGLPKFVIWMMQWMPAWYKMKTLAFTLEYDTLLVKDYGLGKPLNKADWEKIDIPTRVISGTKSEPWAQNSMKQLAEVLPNAEHVDLVGQTHLVNPKIIAPYLIEFFTDRKDKRH